MTQIPNRKKIDNAFEMFCLVIQINKWSVFIKWTSDSSFILCFSLNHKIIYTVRSVSFCLWLHINKCAHSNSLITKTKNDEFNGVVVNTRQASWISFRNTARYWIIKFWNTLCLKSDGNFLTINKSYKL